ncbi:hypothetical protein GmHk_09G024952 [Glycine max]|nr:hypothetical protein GmHk_09G024952 [Glycine max]
MAEDRPKRMTLEDYSSPIIPQYFTSIVRPELIQGNLFHSLPSEDPYALLATYIDICNTVKIVGVPENATRLNLFSFSLASKAKIWLRSFKGNSLRTWDEVVEKFLKKYFLESKTVEGKMEISSFHQYPDESLSETLDRFHGLLRMTPTHGYSEPVRGCHICGGTHASGLCMVQDDASNEVNYMGSHNHQGFHQRGPPGFYQSDNFLQDHDWRYYPRGSPYQHPSQGQSQQEKPPISIEEMLLSLIQETRANTQETRAFIQETRAFIQETRSHQKSTDAAIRNLEIQIGQLAESTAEKPTKTFAVNAEMKHKEDCKVIFTEREEEEKKNEEDVHDEEGEKKEERERNEEKAQQWEKYSQVEIQQGSILQVNTPPYQLIVKEERHGKHEKALSVIISLIATTSLAIM